MDASILAKQIVKLGLVDNALVEECQEEAASLGSEGDHLLRVLERKSLLTPLQIEKLRKGHDSGFILGGYRLLYKIASGSFGRVYRGDELQTGRTVAIKVLRKRWSDKPDQLQLFEREAQLGMSLEHPNIVQILAVGQDASSGQHYLVMEFVEGGNLRDFLAIRKKLAPTEALKMAEEMVSALKYAFSKGLTHRDLKLTNVLISTKGDTKLVDFGLAQMYNQLGRSQAQDINVARTVDYAGLEMATGVKPNDIRSDIYFIGCILYELLTGRPALELTRDRHARMRKQRFEKVEPIKLEEVGGCRPAVQLAETMMSLNPTKRFQTPAQLLQAVKNARAALDGNPGKDKSTRPSIFLIERDTRLQETIRDKLKELGYRVLIAVDPLRAVGRFAQQPFSGLIIDAGTVFEDGIEAFQSILTEAELKNIPCHGILILSENQTEWAGRLDDIKSKTILNRPLKLGQLLRAVKTGVPLDSEK